MNPKTISEAIQLGQLDQVIRGELHVFQTPPEINDDMRPTDHEQFLIKAIYPLALENASEPIKKELEKSLESICHDSLGVFCAMQCYYIHLVNERAGLSPFKIDRLSLPKRLGGHFLSHAQGLHHLGFHNTDLSNDRSYKVTVSGMRILAAEHAIDWGIPLPPAGVASGAA